MSALRSLLPLALLCALASGQPKAAPKVAVSLYYESLCPYCKEFISGSLANAWTKVGQIMDVTLVPWGNARSSDTPDGVVITCQHGEEECRLNMVHACALMLAPSKDVGVDFVICMESGDQDQQACAAQVGLDSAGIDACMKDPATVDEMLRLRDITDAVEPPIRGVPTAEVNGSQHPQNEIIENLISVVCREYTGTKPAGCP